MMQQQLSLPPPPSTTTIIPNALEAKNGLLLKTNALCLCLLV